MAFTQRLPASFFAALQAEMRDRMAETGLDLLIVDHYQDVSYATGFSHYPNERPVAFALSRRGSFLLDAIARVAVMLPQSFIPLEDHILDTAQKARSPSGITRSVH